MAPRKTKKQDLTVPELDKGDHNNKKNLCDFLEQERIAKQMLKEAHDFYKSFLHSKTVTYNQLFEYPGVYFVRPCICAYWRDVTIVENPYSSTKGRPVPDMSDDAEIAIAVTFIFDDGRLRYGRFSEALNTMEDDYIYHSSKEEAKHNKWFKRSYKNFDIAEDLQKEWNKLCSYAGGPLHIESKEFVMKLSDLAKYEGLEGRWYDSDDQWTDDLYVNFDPDRLTEKSQQLFNKHDGYCYMDRNQKTVYAPMLIAVPEVKAYIEDNLMTLNENAKSLYKQKIDNYKFWLDDTVYKQPYLITREGRPIELLTEEIRESEADMKTGLYTVTTASEEDRRAKWRFPSDGPIVVTTYYQEFSFDIANNDLVKYAFCHSSYEENQKRRY